MLAVNLPTLTRDTSSDDRCVLIASGAWTAIGGATLERAVEEAIANYRHCGSIVLDMGRVDHIDTYGAWLIERLARQAATTGQTLSVTDLADRFTGLVGALHAVPDAPAKAPEVATLLAPIGGLGRSSEAFLRDLEGGLNLLGAVGVALLATMRRPWTLRATSLVHHLDRVAWQAVPIVLLITFLIGGIIAQQGFFHFRKFGADLYVVDMVGILVLREIGVLLVAIIVAGRSGSSYTAELGSMKMLEEIDAIRTMGLDPVCVLILPRVLALVIALPALTFLGSMAALYGGGLVASFYGDMAPTIFIERLREAISLTHFKVGILKAPFMALVIGVVACAEGLKVKGSASSLGLQTTASVVKSIFLVIVLDGLFAIY
ncbi:MAG: ABC transporter permease, partial [Proteobacteria bacterium]|nr:ABC transporter permease [Pseudomonadota bacterium]